MAKKQTVGKECWETSQRYHRAPNLSYRQDSLSLTQAALTPREYSRSTVTTDKCCYQYPLLSFTLLLKQLQNMRELPKFTSRHSKILFKLLPASRWTSFPLDDGKKH